MVAQRSDGSAALQPAGKCDDILKNEHTQNYDAIQKHNCINDRNEWNIPCMSVLWQNRNEGGKLFLMADGSTKQNRLTFYQLEAVAGKSLLSSLLSSSLSTAAYRFPNTPGVTGTNRAGGR